MTVRYLSLLAVALLAFGFGQGTQLRFSYDSYLYLVLNVDQVLFDFQAEEASNPGLLTKLEPRTYPTYAMPAASEKGLAQCLKTDEAPRGDYLGTTTSTDIDPLVCRFAPTQVTRNTSFKVTYLRTGEAGCEGPLYSDGDLLILSNTTWRVQARITGGAPPSWITLHVLPLTFKDPNTLCAKKPLNDAQVASRDKRLSTSRTTLSRDPTANNSKAYYTQFQGIFALPMLYYLELDLSQFDPRLAGESQTIVVEYLVRPR